MDMEQEKNGCKGCIHEEVCMYKNLTKSIVFCDRFSDAREMDRLRDENERMRLALIKAGIILQSEGGTPDGMDKL